MANQKNQNTQQENQNVQETAVVETTNEPAPVAVVPAGKLKEEITAREAAKVLAKKICLAAGGLVALGAAAWAGHKWWPNN